MDPLLDRIHRCPRLDYEKLSGDRVREESGANRNHVQITRNMEPILEEGNNRHDLQSRYVSGDKLILTVAR